MTPSVSAWPKEGESPAPTNQGPLELAQGRRLQRNLQNMIPFVVRLFWIIPPGGYTSGLPTKGQRSQARLPKDYGLWLTTPPVPLSMKA